MKINQEKVMLDKARRLMDYGTKEMVNFIEKFEKKSHIGLVGNRKSIVEDMPYEISYLMSTNGHLPFDVLKSIIDSFIIRPWQSAIILQYQQFFEEGEIEVAKLVLEAFDEKECDEDALDSE